MSEEAQTGDSDRELSMRETPLWLYQQQGTHSLTCNARNLNGNLITEIPSSVFAATAGLAAM
jgi:hypothetical protein